jgi:hypothetical protein
VRGELQIPMSQAKRIIGRIMSLLARSLRPRLDNGARDDEKVSFEHSRSACTNEKGVTESLDHPFWSRSSAGDYLVFFSVASDFFSSGLSLLLSVISEDFLADFLVLVFLALPLVSSDLSAVFSMAFSLFFSVAAGVAGFAGVAGVACAKLTPLNANRVNATRKALIVFCTVSPPFNVLDVVATIRFK